MSKPLLPHACRWVLLWFGTILLVSWNNHCNAFSPLGTEQVLAVRQPSCRITQQQQLNAAPNGVENNKEEEKRERKRDRILRTITGRCPPYASKNTPTSNTRREITTQQELDEHWQDPDGQFRRSNGQTDYTALLRGVSVKGDTQIIGSPQHLNYTHPVVKLIHERRRRLENKDSSTDDDDDDDGAKVILAVEGGGMRGCVSAGMVCALHCLNLTDTIDAVYGSSAGTIVGAYLITNQLPWFGPELYYDRLTSAGREFIDTRRLLRALGFGLLDPRLFKDVVTRRDCAGKPVLNLNYLLKRTVQETKPLDWDTFARRQKVQPLNVIASGLQSERSVILNMANGGFETLEELTDCMHASCLLPGIAGPLMNIHKSVLRQSQDGKSQSSSSSSSSSSLPPGVPKMILGNNLDDPDYEPLADALLYEPLPYRTAIAQDGATHCIVIRSRPDGVDVTGKGGIFEKLIAHRIFKRKNRLPHMYDRLKQHLHKKLYAEDVIRLNQEAYSERDYRDLSQPHLLAIAGSPGMPEVTRLEVGREAIFQGIRHGFARAYDCLVEDPNLRGQGAQVAARFFPDEILDYHPLDVDVTDQSAFAAYMERQGISPKSWEADQIREEIEILQATARRK